MCPWCADIAEDEDAGQAAKKARGPLEQADPMEADAGETANAAGTALGPAAAAPGAHDSPASAKAASATADGVTAMPRALLLLFLDTVRVARFAGSFDSQLLQCCRCWQ
jgi:hypothetical protein